jgi:catechol 2,3-dioxygenase-like lactoylglutathione lyase family enzyme
MVEPVTVLFGGIPVRDYEAAERWYEGLLGRAPDMRPKEGEVCWKLADDAWIYVVRDPERAGNALITIIGDELPDVDAETFELGGMRCVEVLDPDGNKLKFAQRP